MARSIFCLGFKRKERNHHPMVLLRKHGHRWLIPSRHYRTRNPLSIVLFSGEEFFSYPGLRLRRAKSALSAGGSASCLFSSQAPYPYLFLGWHNKERECQETTHTPPLLEGSGSSGSPYRRKDLTSLNRHYYLSAPTTRPSSARRARPWPLLVSSS